MANIEIKYKLFQVYCMPLYMVVAYQTSLVMM